MLPLAIFPNGPPCCTTSDVDKVKRHKFRCYLFCNFWQYNASVLHILTQPLRTLHLISLRQHLLSNNQALWI